MSASRIVSKSGFDPATRCLEKRALFALNAAERALFFPAGLKSSHFDWLWVSTESGWDGMAAALLEFEPQALVTSWSTPPLSEKLLEEQPGLRCICHTAGSVRNLVPRAFLERNVLVTNWGALAASAVAEHALLLILAGLRRLPEWPPVISGEKRWQPSPIVTQTLFGKRVGVHGFGNVARALAALLRPFGVQIAAFSSGVPTELFASHGVFRSESLEDLFSGSDILVECEALNAQSCGSVTRKLLEQLPADALFVNVGRGAVVEETALADMARSGRIRLALDVFASDPIARNSALKEVEGAILSPHIAGPTSDQFIHCGKLVARNIEAFFRGQPLEAVVTLEMYDRAT